MTITPISVDIFLPAPKSPRSKGLHVSNIIRCVAAETGILKPEYVDDLSLTDYREITDPVAILRMSIGLAWEQYYIPEILSVMYGAVDHPRELELDGVYMSPDAESISSIKIAGSYLPEIHEAKATYKSTATVGDMTSQWMWLAQLKSYCKAAKTTIGYMHVLFICGDYKFPITPQLRAWKIEFEQSELDINWDMLMQYVKQRRLEEAA